MKAAILGADGYALDQVPAVRAGFAALGHEWTKDLSQDVAFVFGGNPWYDEIWDDYQRRGKTKPLILNVLDIPTHCDDFDYDKMIARLAIADRVTCISQFVKGQLRDMFGIDANVIYYPMKPVFKTNEVKYPNAKVFMGGRLNDKNKNAGAAISALVRAGYEESQVAIVGPENPRYGVYHGIVSDDKLNDLYNSVDYAMMLSVVEGIGLVSCEAACAGAIPIVAPHLTTFNEFWAGSPMGPFYHTFTSIDKIAQFMINMNNHPDEKTAMKAAMLEYGNRVLRPLFDKTAVAARIIDVYHSI